MKCYRLLLLSVLVPVGLGCHRPSGTPGRLLIAIDVSCQEPMAITRLATMAYRSQRGLPSAHTVRVLAFAHEMQPVYEGPPLKSRGEFNTLIGHRLIARDPGLNRPGTRTDRTLERLALEIRRSRVPVSVIILTDGGIEDLSPAATQRIDDSVRLLSGATELRRLTVLGVQDRFRLQWEEWLAPLGTRGVIRGTGDAGSALLNLAGLKDPS